MRSSTRMRSSISAMRLEYCAAFSALVSAVMAMRFSSSLAWLRTQTMPITIRNGASVPTIGISSPISMLLRRWLAQAFDLGRKARIARHVVSLDLGQAAVDVAEARADFAGRALGRLAYALPVPLFFLVYVKMRRLLHREQAQREIGGQTEAGADRQDNEAQPPPDRIDAG